MGAFLDAAYEALAFIEAQAEGDIWRVEDAPGAKTGHNFYHGAGGVVILLLELHRQSGDPRLLRRAIAAGDAVINYLGKGRSLSVGMGRGWPGFMFTLCELAKASGEARFREAAAACARGLRASATPLGSGIGWIEPAPFADITGFTDEREVIDLSVGAAGGLIGFVYAAREGLASEALDWAAAAAERLLEVAEETPDGLRWPMMADMPFPFTAPNFAHGGAGVGYALLQLFRENGDRRHLDAAISAARYTMSRAHAVGENGCLICHTEERRKPIFYLGVCHGPAGTGRLLAELSDITGDAVWESHLAQLMRGLENIGAPEERSAGLWRNFGQCCGDAGIGDFALFLARRPGGEANLAFARRIGDLILAESEIKDGKRFWRQAEHRERPDFIQAQTGYMQGAAGIASFLAHLAQPDGRAKIPTPDMPRDRAREARPAN